MTTHMEKRCAHCQTRYWFQSSGYGCNQDHNDGKYCRDCAKVIAEALGKVSAKFERVMVETDEVSADALMAFRNSEVEKVRAKGGLVCERVVAPLFDMRDGTNIFSGVFVRFEGREYLVETWSKTPERNTVRVAMEKDLKTGKLIPWKELK